MLGWLWNFIHHMQAVGTEFRWVAPKKDRTTIKAARKANVLRMMHGK